MCLCLTREISTGYHGRQWDGTSHCAWDGTGLGTGMGRESHREFGAPPFSSCPSHDECNPFRTQVP